MLYYQTFVDSKSCTMKPCSVLSLLITDSIGWCDYNGTQKSTFFVTWRDHSVCYVKPHHKAENDLGFSLSATLCLLRSAVHLTEVHQYWYVLNVALTSKYCCSVLWRHLVSGVSRFNVQQ